MKLFSYPLSFIYATYIIGFTMIFTFFIPPYEKPDEIAHVNRAFALSNGQLFCTKNSEGYGFSIPETLTKFPNTMFTQAIIMQPKGKFPISALKGKYPIYSSKTVWFKNYCTLPFLSYIPSAIMMKTVEPLNNLLVTFYAARFGMAAFFILCLTASFLIIPQSYRLLLVASSVIPMVIHQATAVSYDSPSIALSLVTCSLFVKYIELKSVRFRDYVVFICILSIFLLMKQGYYFLFALLLPVYVRIKGTFINKGLLALATIVVVYGIFQLSIHL